MKSNTESLDLLRKIWLAFLLVLLFSSMSILFGLLKIAPERFPINFPLKEIPLSNPIRYSPSPSSS
jgi:hypothetical protein